MKICTKCKKELPETMYFKDSHLKSGLHSCCKPCSKEASTKITAVCEQCLQEFKTRKTAPGKFCTHKCAVEWNCGENNGNWKGGITSDVNKYMRHWSRDNPLYRKAYNAFHMALRKGTIRVEPCVRCGSEKNIEAHHKDYTRPLDIKWYCRKCHRWLHKNSHS